MQSERLEDLCITKLGNNSYAITIPGLAWPGPDGEKMEMEMGCGKGAARVR